MYILKVLRISYQRAVGEYDSLKSLSMCQRAACVCLIGLAIYCGLGIPVILSPYMIHYTDFNFQPRYFSSYWMKV